MVGSPGGGRGRVWGGGGGGGGQGGCERRIEVFVKIQNKRRIEIFVKIQKKIGGGVGGWSGRGGGGRVWGSGWM